MQKGKPATAGSKMLADFISPIDATVAERLESAGIDITGRARMDEFGLRGLLSGSECQSLNAQDGALTGAVDVFEAMGSLTGGKPDLIFCNDFNGSLSHAAAAQGVYYIHPTYGTVSRYGLIPAVSSMDQIGVACRTPENGFRALRIIAGYDPKDGAMIPEKVTGKNVPANLICETGFESGYSGLYAQVTQILSCAELSNNISRYDGIKYGYRAKEYNSLQELYTKSRTEAFGPELKLAAILGTMVLSQENYKRYYDKAMRMRRVIKESLDFDNYDVIVTQCPLLSRLCGLPSLTTPERVYIADAGREDILEAVSLSFQQ